MKSSFSLLLADSTLRYRMYPAGKVAISWHLVIPGLPHCDHTVGNLSVDVSIPFVWITGHATYPNCQNMNSFKAICSVWIKKLNKMKLRKQKKNLENCIWLSNSVDRYSQSIVSCNTGDTSQRDFYVMNLVQFMFQDCLRSCVVYTANVSPIDCMYTRNPHNFSV